MRQSADRRRFRHARGIRGILAVAASSLLALAIPARAADVTIVLSGKATPYVKAEKELKARLVKLGHTTRTVELGKLADEKEFPRGGSDDVFVAVGTPATVWLKANLSVKTPLVYCMTSETFASTSGRKIAGVGTSVPVGRQLALIAEALPQAKRVGVLYRSESKKSLSMLAGVRNNLPQGWKLNAVALDKHESVAKAIDALLAEGTDVVWTTADSAVYDVATVRSLLLAAIRSRTPVFGFSPAFVRAGALLGVGICPARQGRQAAGLVDPLLKAVKTTSSAATQPESRKQELTPEPEYQLAVNLVVARRLSITLPKNLIDRAVHVFGGDEEEKK